MRVSKSVMSVGGVVLASMLIGFASPKTVRAAVTALLVQVTNTASNPVVNGEVTRSAPRLVQIYCEPYSNECNQVGPGASLSQSQYVVPSGQELVITDILVDTPSNTVPTEIVLPPVNPVGGITWTWVVANDGTTHHIAMQSGFVWPAGQSITVSTNNIHAHVMLQGYLTGKHRANTD